MKGKANWIEAQNKHLDYSHKKANLIKLRTYLEMKRPDAVESQLEKTSLKKMGLTPMHLGEMLYDNHYYDLKRRNGNYPFNEDIRDEYEEHIRSIPLEKNINRNRIKKIENINDDNYYYNNEPMIYYQREANQIKNSYMNESLGLSQTSQKIEYYNRRRNNLIFSSNKIPFKKINYNNINQSIDLLFSK